MGQVHHSNSGPKVPRLACSDGQWGSAEQESRTPFSQRIDITTTLFSLGGYRLHFSTRISSTPFAEGFLTKKDESGSGVVFGNGRSGSGVPRKTLHLTFTILHEHSAHTYIFSFLSPFSYMFSLGREG